MKKSILFASLIAFAAIFASCDKKPEAPSARFGYDSNEKTVTFQNLSKEADSFVWEFGDGETSTEFEPVHEYADYGVYTVKLTATNAGGSAVYTDEIELIKRIIALDGDFSDWAAIDNKVAKCEANESAAEDYFYAAKFVRDNEYVYFYLDFSAAKDDFIVENEETGDEEEINDYAVKHMSLWLDFGATTGCNIWWWSTDSWIDFLIEGSWEDQFEGATVYQCPEDLNGGDNAEWIWNETGIAGAVASCKIQDLGNGHSAIEGKIMVKLLPLDAEGDIRMAIGALGPDWGTYTGRLPQATEEDGGTTTLGSLIVVPLVAE